MSFSYLIGNLIGRSLGSYALVCLDNGSHPIFVQLRT